MMTAELERFARAHGLETPDMTALREAEARFDALLESARNAIPRRRGLGNQSPDDDE